MTEIAPPVQTHADLAAAHNGENGDNNHHRPPSSHDSELSEPDETQFLSYENSPIRGRDGREGFEVSTDHQSPAEGRSRVNGSGNRTHDSEVTDAERPAKRRRVRGTTPDNSARRPKPESPPWKKVEAEGPSSFMAGDGRRKSGRINTVPLELQRGDKRITRRSLHGAQASPPKNRYASTNGHSPATNQTPSSVPSKRPLSSSKHVPTKAPSTKLPTPKPATPEKKSNARTRRRSLSPRRPATPTRPSAGTRRSMRHARDNNENNGDNTSPGALRSTPRSKSRPRPPLTTIPLVHRDQANIRPKLGPTFEQYIERALSIPVEEGGLLLPSEDGPRYTDDMARQDAVVLLRVEKEVEPGGILASNKCSVFEPEAAEEPPRQWTHTDHLTKAMTNFRKLLVIEQQRHRASAKRLALACEAEWRRRNPQPKTAEEVELEQIERSRTRWRQVTRAVAGTWDNVKVEINRRRLVEWEAKEQRRVKDALNQAVNISEQKLQQRQARLGTEDPTEYSEDNDDMISGMEDEDEGDFDDDADEESRSRSGADESNMSSSSDDEDKDSVLSDEGLSQAQLQAKYANLPALETNGDEGETLPANLDSVNKLANGKIDDGDDDDGDDDTSDESIDMDDDLGSTDDESEEGGDEGGPSSGSEGEDSEDEPTGLLGLFFKKSELKKLQDVTPSETGDVEDIDMADADIPTESPREPGGHLNEADVSGDRCAPMPGSVGERSTKGDDEEGVYQTPALINRDNQTRTEHPSEADDLHQSSPGLLSTPSRACLPSAAQSSAQWNAEQSALGAAEDISMTDAPALVEPSRGEVPDVEITEAPPNGQDRSPNTDATTNPHSPSRSQSPRASDDTKPTDTETSASASLLNVPKTDSRSTSPQPTVPKTEIPSLLRGTLREYQHHGLDWLAALYANKTNGILADEMGLGKTIQTIALLAHLACHHEVWGPHLVIVPTSVMLNWEMEFKKWCPGFKILTYYGNQEERKRKRQGWNNDDIWNVCITSYQMVLQDQQVFRRRRWHYMILDEAHNIKNFKSQRWQTLLGFNTQARLLLTGTPLQNNLTELWSLLYFLAPPENGEGGFVDLREFHNWFARPESQILENGREQLDDEARAIIAKLHKVLRPYLLRRLKADVEKQMPGKYEHVEFCRLSKRQRELYDGFLSRNDTRATLESGNYMSIINCLMQLRKVCNHPDLFVDRPIMTSFRMQRSVPVAFEVKEHIIRNKLLAVKPMSLVSLDFLNMIPTRNEGLSDLHTDRIAQLSSHRILLNLREAQKIRAKNGSTVLDPATVKSNSVFLESAARWGRFEELQHCVYVNALRRHKHPIYGKRLIDLLTLDTQRRPYKQRPKVPQKIMSWFEEDLFLLHNAIPTLQQRAASMEMTITKFACVTPAVVTGDLNKFLLGAKGIEAFQDEDLRLSAPVKYAPYMPKEAPVDPWHEARMRLTIQFPDKRLLQYDCGKLQALDRLLRKLQAGGHRALIFTQMTKVLDILEQFLNIHGHKYLRLDGSTKVEQRQILTDRFNHDQRILCFILSTRSGGLGINLTGADTVIFYDQDWNPAMDKQCQDRCHRIGQTRDVHIYRLVSEHTIEANILRKASQKQMLDDVVIQEGEFTTDYFNKISVRDVVNSTGEVSANENDIAANAAMDKVLGGVQSSNPRQVGRALEQAEDTEDVAAARLAEKEIQQDDADFLEQQPTPGGSASGVSSVRQGTPSTGIIAEPGRSGLGLFVMSAQEVPQDDVAITDGPIEVEYSAFGKPVCTIDDHMLSFMAEALKDVPLDLPKDKKKSKKRGKDIRKR
ncbi:SNF2 family N-terminal domain-containing protein [Lasiosphaeria miniovina]|uniref:DNA helicase n=1 Tax=Lasiosphaeria miniovina TaxID=1954250 RepID=A0AA40DTL2_9PEZI|nr:SNF2 family N-terminal domain-containing protein [Lasiosphaeria miniovina]KAK0712956.1 SNF2 family N-terminal domain-containing protein [Lasiosphaeria miniovina]